jgi:hypothetical protein
VGHRVAEAIPCCLQQVGDITKQVDKRRSVWIPNFVGNVSFKSLFSTKVVEFAVGRVPITCEGNNCDTIQLKCFNSLPNDWIELHSRQIFSRVLR